MKKSIQYSIIIALNIFSTLFSAVHAQNQEQSDYYYLGYTFKQVDGVKTPSPYLTVVFIGGDSNTPKAVTMSNSIGEISFKGIPMNLYTENKFEVYAGNKLIGVYLPGKWTQKPPFPPCNINTHMEVPSKLDFYTEKELALPTRGSISLREFFNEIPEMEVDEDNFFIKGREGSVRLFVNNNSLPADKFKAFLDNLTTDYIKSCRLIVFNEPNKYFSGAISITLVVGDPGRFPADTKYIKSLPLSE